MENRQVKKVLFISRDIPGKRKVRQKYGNWPCVAAEKVLEKEGTQFLGAYIDRWQATVAEFVALCPILEV